MNRPAKQRQIREHVVQRLLDLLREKDKQAEQRSLLENYPSPNGSKPQ